MAKQTSYTQIVVAIYEVEKTSIKLMSEYFYHSLKLSV